MNTIIYIIIGLVVGGTSVYTYLLWGGKKRLKKFEHANRKKIEATERKLLDMEHKANLAETKLREKILDAKNKALEIIEESKKEERKMRMQLEKQEERIISKEDVLEKNATEFEKKKN